TGTTAGCLISGTGSGATGTGMGTNCGGSGLVSGLVSDLVAGDDGCISTGALVAEGWG
ncbi:MAG: hypothetical protein HC770_07950, partial [Pseudanabaena sp. CRU_2_10]|nr:hypothetical protein [Pseudanabaena sp. CRU_2_10]